MRKLAIIAALAAAMTASAYAASKVDGESVLKDLQPAGVRDKHAKHGKHQVYDLTFDAAGNEYICRTDPDKSVNPTDFIVGGSMQYEIDGKKAKIRTAGDKKVGCQIVRVALIPATPGY